MARLSRLTFADMPHHVIQRGNNREIVFVDSADYEYFLDLLRAQAQVQEVAIHAYVLMPNHFHLLLTPKSNVGLSKLMQALGRRYVRYFNDRHHRSGTLWEGRYRSTVLQVEKYLLTCMAYLDLNPVRHQLATQARDYAWSSHAHYIGQRRELSITPHPHFWSLGNTPFSREAAYEAMVHHGVTTELQHDLTQSALHGWALGDATFLESLQNRGSRRVSPGKAGRPRKKANPLNVDVQQQGTKGSVNAAPP